MCNRYSCANTSLQFIVVRKTTTFGRFVWKMGQWTVTIEWMRCEYNRRFCKCSWNQYWHSPFTDLRKICHINSKSSSRDDVIASEARERDGRLVNCFNNFIYSGWIILQIQLCWRTPIKRHPDVVNFCLCHFLSMFSSAIELIVSNLLAIFNWLSICHFPVQRSYIQFQPRGKRFPLLSLPVTPHFTGCVCVVWMWNVLFPKW